jgi:tetratricopeptide (TPR) repeat protein
MVFKFRYWLFLSGAFLQLLSSCSKEPAKDKLVDPNQKQDGSASMKVYTEAIEAEPNNPENYRKRANAYLKANQADLALKDIDQALALDSAKGEYIFLKSQILRAKKEVPTALRLLLRAERKGIQDEALYLSAGEMYFILKQYQQSLTYLNLALKKGPFNERAYYFKGLVYAESGDTTRAISSLETALEQEPSYTDAYATLIKIYNAKKDYKTAQQYVNSGLRFAPDDAMLLFHKGVTQQGLGKADSAITTFQYALQRDTALYLAHYNLGILHYRKGNFQAAIPHFLAAKRHDSELPFTDLMLADSYEQTKQYDKAFPLYKVAFDNYPDDKRLQAAVKRTYDLAEKNRAAGPSVQ